MEVLYDLVKKKLRIHPTGSEKSPFNPTHPNPRPIVTMEENVEY